MGSVIICVVLSIYIPWFGILHSLVSLSTSQSTSVFSKSNWSVYEVLDGLVDLRLSNI